MMRRVPAVRPGGAPETTLPADPAAAPATARSEAVPRAMGKGPTHAAAGGFRPDIEGLRAASRSCW